MARWLVLDDGNGGVLAYAGMWFVLDEAHVCNVAVRPDCRGKGYGKRIFTALILSLIHIYRLSPRTATTRS